MSKKNMNRRAYALEAALDALSAGIGRDVAWTAEPEEVLAYAKFILGERPAKWKRRKVQGGERRAYTAEAGTPLPDSLEGLEAKGWKPLGFLTEDGLKEDLTLTVSDLFRRDARPDLAVPTIAGGTLDAFAEKVRDGDLAADPEPASAFRPVGEDPGDREVLTQWAEAIRQQDAAREAAREAAALEAEPEVGETNDSAGAAEWIAEWIADDGRPSWDSRPEVRSVTFTPASAPVDKRIAEEAMGLVPGALDEDLTITNEGTFLSDGSPAEKALREDLSVKPAPSLHSAAISEEAPDYVLRQGKGVGCRECEVELERREKRDEALKRGRSKLAGRRRDGWPSSDLDEDELLAVAGSELYPANDEEPARGLKIRNRKGEVRSYASGTSKSPGGWTSTPADPWGLRLAWTFPEMSRRGPWHVI